MLVNWSIGEEQEEEGEQKWKVAAVDWLYCYLLHVIWWMLPPSAAIYPAFVLTVTHTLPSMHL
jgi:hypothetical protein